MALEDATAKFTVSLKDDTSKGAGTAGRALSQLQSQMRNGQKEIAAIRKQMSSLKAANQAGSAAYLDLEKRLQEVGERTAKAHEKFLALGGVMSRNYTQKAAGDHGRLAKILGMMPGTMGRMMSAGRGMSEVLAGTSAKTLVLAAASTALVAGVALAAGALTKYGIAVGDARRNEALQLEGMTKIRNWYGLTADSAGFLQNQIDEVSASSAIGRDQVAAYAKQLYGMGLRAGNLQQALKGVATVASTQGDAQAQMFAGMAAGAAAAGGSVRKLAADVQARLGGVAAKQMLSLNVQAMKLKENIAFLFSGLGIDKFLSGLSKIYEMFSATSVTGKALKAIIEVMIQPLIDGAGTAMGVLRRLFQGATIGALLLMIGFLKVRNAIRDALAGSAVEKAFKGLNIGVDGVTLALGTAVVVFAAVGYGMYALAAATIAATWPLLAVVAVAVAFFAAGYKLTEWLSSAAPAAWNAFSGAVNKALDFIRNIDVLQLGKDIVMGIANGIKNGASWVIDAVKQLADMTVDGFKIALGIKSPSRVFMEQGKQVGAGAALGIEESSGDVQAAADAMAPTPNMGSQRGGSSGGSVTIGEIHIHSDAKDPKGLAMAFRDELAVILEGAAFQVGALA